MNIWDILLLAAIGTALFFAIRAVARGKSCGCGGCDGCSGCDRCGTDRADCARCRQKKHNGKRKPKS